MKAHIDEGGAPGTARWEIALVAAVVGLAALLRVWRIGDLPPGLHVDEAFNILDAREVLAGARPVFLLENAGRDVLYTYLQAPLLALFGESPAVARLTSALAGTLTVFAVWGFTRTLPLRRARLVALLTAAFVAFSYWHVHFSRFGIRAVLFPLVVTGAMWAWWRIVGTREPLPSASDDAAGNRPSAGEGSQPEAGGVDLSAATPAGSARSWTWSQVAMLGVLLGLAFYVHPVGRALWLVPLVHAVYQWLRTRDARPLQALGPALLVAGLLALPLISFWNAHPGSFSGHASEVSVLDGGPTAVAGNALAVAGMFNVAGDPAPWRNLKERPILYRALAAAGVDRDDPAALALRGRPVFDPLTGVLFLAGLALALAAAWRGADWAAFVLIWLALMLAPSVLTDAAPNFSRAIGALPVVCLLPALALDRLAEATRQRLGGRWAAVVVVLLVAAYAFGTTYDYFVVWAGHEDTGSAFDEDKAALARYADELAATGTSVYLSAAMADHPTVKVSASGDPRGFDPRHGLVLPAGQDIDAAYVYLASEVDARQDIENRTGQTVEELVFDGHDLAEARLDGVSAWDALSPGREPLDGESAGYGPLGARPVSEDDATVLFGERIRFAGWGVPGDELIPGETGWITLVWEAVEPVEHDLTTALQISAVSGKTLAHGDDRPVGGTYPTQSWRPRELVASVHPTELSDGVDADTALVSVGWYDLLEDAPLVPLTTPSGATIVTIDEIPVAPKP